MNEPLTGQKKKGILSFDFDSTLFCHDHAQKGIPTTPECINTILKLSKKGWKWGINTGRSLDLLLKDLPLCNIPLHPDFIVSREREIHFLDPKTQTFLTDINWKARCQLLHNQMYERESQMLERVQRHIKKNTKAQWISEPGDEAGIIASSIQEMNDILCFINQEIAHLESVSYLRSTIYMRFTHIDFHKGTSLKHVAEKFQINREKVFAIGDGENDLGMLNPVYAGMISCPSNAEKKVKEIIAANQGYISKSPTSQGVHEALVHFIK